MMKKLFLFTVIVALAACSKENTNTENHLPKAAFSVIPERAEPGDTILFDANIVTDREDPSEKLLVQWSWNGDKVYTPYTLEKTAIHIYDQVGVYFPELQVKDTYDLTDTLDGMVVIVQDINNLPPTIPVQVSPLEWQDWVEPSLTFKWKAGTDPEDDPMTFDLWLGKSKNTMSIVASDIDFFNMVEGERVYETNISGLLLGQDYYWQVAAKDSNGNYTRGWIWKFVTKPG
ncbi:MAG TPA: hypothetical protein VK212_05475 [Lentimicrobium sp.]|nr:hypothetical protein [Lentimicrobium sp.]